MRGTFVTGLTDGDIRRLDYFEGSQYDRCEVKVRLLTHVGDESGEGNIEGEEVEAETYVWRDDERYLEDGEWDFALFRRERMRNWVGESEEFEGSTTDLGVLKDVRC